MLREPLMLRELPMGAELEAVVHAVGGRLRRVEQAPAWAWLKMLGRLLL